MFVFTYFSGWAGCDTRPHIYIYIYIYIYINLAGRKGHSRSILNGLKVFEFRVFLIEILLMFVTPYFSRTPDIYFVVANANSILLKTPLKVLNLSYEYVLHFVEWEVFISNIFSLCLWLSTLTSTFPFLVYLTFLGVTLIAINFSHS